MNTTALSRTISNTSDLALCHAACVNLYTLAIKCLDEDIAARALFLLSEMEHYNHATLPTPARRKQIERFLFACASLRQRIEKCCPAIPELSAAEAVPEEIAPEEI